MEHGDRLIFMHAVKDGPANRSFGLQVASLAGLPEDRCRLVVGDIRDAETVDRLVAEHVARCVTATGHPCHYETGTDAIIERLVSDTMPGDVIIVFSNGGFDGMHEKLLARL